MAFTAASVIKVERGEKQFQGMFEDMWNATLTVDPASIAAAGEDTATFTIPGIALTLVGLPVEIEPLVQCTSLWAGSAFTGIVRFQGKPALRCRVEVEYLNDQGALKLPDNSFRTQILNTNAKGEFTFVPPRAGWWALTAIPESKQMTRSPEGRKVNAELGGVLWIRCVDMK